MGTVTKHSAQLLRVSTTRIDGGSVFGGVPKERWEQFVSPDRQNRVALGNYCMLVPEAGGWMLVNTGPGDKAPLSADSFATRGRSSLLRNLRDLGIMPKEITTVVLTHLHSEHAGGATHCTSSGRVLPTFTHARYIVQRAAWEEACAPSERHGRQYRADDFLPFEETGQLELVDGPARVAPGVCVEPAPGPTVGHQAVLAEVGGYHVAFLGILAPTVFHWVASVASAWDSDPEETLASRQRLFRKGLSERWWLAPAGCDRWVEATELLRPAFWRRALGGEPVEPELPPLPVADPVAAAV